MTNATAAPAPEKTPQTLDDVMLAMDVVDTIRHREIIVARELGQGARDVELRSRLREIYAAQGIAVSDAALEQGIRALQESRFVYTPPPPSFGRTLAHLWVRRRFVATVGGAVLVAAVLAWGGYQAVAVWPQQWAAARSAAQFGEEYPAALAAAFQTATAEAQEDPARQQAATLNAQGQAAIAARNEADVQAALAGLQALVERLRTVYALRIVNRPGEDTGVWRVPDANTRARNFYIVVEPVAPDGDRLRVSVLNEETGRTERVRRYAVRVSEETFDAVRRDKTDDGILQTPVLGEKRRGFLDVTWTLPVQGGAITEW